MVNEELRLKLSIADQLSQNIQYSIFNFKSKFLRTLLQKILDVKSRLF